MDNTHKRPRRRDQAFWTTHVRQRGDKNPRQPRAQAQQAFPEGSYQSSSDKQQKTISPPPNLLPLSYHYYPPRRPFDHIESEHQYLQYQLGEQSRQERDLFSQIAAVDIEDDEACVYPKIRRPDHERRRQARKHYSWLQFCIDEAMEQERQILARLSEIYMEIQCLERWHMVEQFKVYFKQQQGWGQRQVWVRYDDYVANDPRSKQRLNRGSRYHQYRFGPTTSAADIVRSYVDQQPHEHTSLASHHRSSIAVEPDARYRDSFRPARKDWRHRRSIPREVKVRYVQPILEREDPKKKPARRSRSISDASYEVEGGTQHRSPRDPLHDSRLPARRQSLPTMRYY